MRIKLKRGWFAPDTSGHTTLKYVGRNGRPVARGELIKKGFHDVPEEWRDKLPSDAEVFADDYVEPPEENLAPEPSMRDGALFAAALQSQSLINDEADQAAKMEERRVALAKQNRQEGAARAREAKKQKQEKADA